MEIINEKRFKEILSESKLVLIDFYAEWCGPCKMLAPVLEQLADVKKDVLKVAKVNVDNEENLAWQFGIQSIPTMILFKDGNPIKKEIGYRSLDYLIRLINDALEN